MVWFILVLKTEWVNVNVSVFPPLPWTHGPWMPKDRDPRHGCWSGSDQGEFLQVLRHHLLPFPWTISEHRWRTSKSTWPRCSSQRHRRELPAERHEVWCSVAEVWWWRWVIDITHSCIVHIFCMNVGVPLIYLTYGSCSCDLVMCERWWCRKVLKGCVQFASSLPQSIN